MANKIGHVQTLCAIYTKFVWEKIASDETNYYLFSAFQSRQSTNWCRATYMDSQQSSSSSVDIIHDVLGDWGKWQLRTTLLIYLCKIPSAWFMACIIFTAPFAQPGEYFCRRRIESIDPDVWISVVHPSIGDANSSIDYCHVYANSPNSSSSLNIVFDERDNESILTCSGYEHRSIYDSLVTQFDLVCSRTILIAVTQFWHLFGVLTGGIVATYLLNQFESFQRIPNRKIAEPMKRILCANRWIFSFRVEFSFSAVLVPKM